MTRRYVTANPKKGVYLKKKQGYKPIADPSPVTYSWSRDPADPGSVNILKMAEMRGNPDGTYKKAFDYVNKSELESITQNPYKTVLDVIDRYNMRMVAPIAYIYGQGSRVMKGTEDLLAVRLTDKRRGWLNVNTGAFFSEADLGRLMRSLDGTLIGAATGLDLYGMVNSMNATQRATLWDAIKDVDWDRIWDEVYDPNDPFDEKLEDAYNLVVTVMDDILNQ